MWNSPALLLLKSEAKDTLRVCDLWGDPAAGMAMAKKIKGHRLPGGLYLYHPAL